MSPTTKSKTTNQDAAAPKADAGALSMQERLEIAAKKLEQQSAIQVGSNVRPTNFGEVMQLAEVFFKSKVVPASLDSKEAVAVGIMACIEADVPILFGLSRSYVIGNRHAFWGDLITAKLLSVGVRIAQRYTGQPMSDDWTCHVKLKRPGEDWTEETTYSVADAKQAGLWAGGKTKEGNKASESSWSKDPKTMMFWRAFGRNVKLNASDIISGMTLAEELIENATEVEILQTRPAEESDEPDPLMDEVVEGEIIVNTEEAADQHE